MNQDVRVYVTIGHCPSYDSAPLCAADLTDIEYRALRDRIGRYMKECAERRDRERATSERLRMIEKDNR